ncbi:protein of unknown function [Cupriavidus taiwanensis]|nr:protein of unknown function [Cupriavidus taiwanensis]
MYSTHYTHLKPNPLFLLYISSSPIYFFIAYDLCTHAKKIRAIDLTPASRQRKIFLKMAC